MSKQSITSAILALSLTLILAACQTTTSSNSEPINISRNVTGSFLSWTKLASPADFIVSTDGAYSASYYCPNYGSCNLETVSLIMKCERVYNSKCRHVGSSGTTLSFPVIAPAISKNQMVVELAWKAENGGKSYYSGGYVLMDEGTKGTTNFKIDDSKCNLEIDLGAGTLTSKCEQGRDFMGTIKKFSDQSYNGLARRGNAGTLKVYLAPASYFRERGITFAQDAVALK